MACIIGGLLFASGWIAPTTTLLYFLSVTIVGIGVYAGRSLYFAVMRIGKIPIVLTGTAVGLVSLVGYTPDIFAGLLSGYLLDSNPGELGHQLVFLMLACFSLVGGIAGVIYHRKYGMV